MGCVVALAVVCTHLLRDGVQSSAHGDPCVAAHAHTQAAKELVHQEHFRALTLPLVAL